MALRNGGVFSATAEFLTSPGSLPRHEPITGSTLAVALLAATQAAAGEP